jgi:hypothetical protein
MLAMARILRTGAKLLLLDEITEGLAPVIVKKLGEGDPHELKSRGFTIVLVEQNFRFAAPLADRHYVLEHGEIIATITADELPGPDGLAAPDAGGLSGRAAPVPRVTTTGTRRRPTMHMKKLTTLACAAAFTMLPAPPARRSRATPSRSACSPTCRAPIPTLSGAGAVVATKMAIEDFIAEAKPAVQGRDGLRRPPEQGRHRLQQGARVVRARGRRHRHRAGDHLGGAGGDEDRQGEEPHRADERRRLDPDHQRALQRRDGALHLRHLCAGQRHRQGGDQDRAATPGSS